MDYLKKIAKNILKTEAKLILKKYKPKVIAITGSVGKTLTREAIYSVLSKKFFVRKNEKSFTAELGVALTIIGCQSGNGSLFHWIYNIILGIKVFIFKTNYPEWLILEIDVDKPGDLEGVASYIPPDILVMTAIGDVPSHIELFGTVEDFLEEKKTIINKLKRDGVIIYNADDLKTSQLLDRLLLKKVSCGVTGWSDVFGDEWQTLYSKDGKEKKNSIPTGMSFSLTHKSEKYPLSIMGTIGVQNQYASLLAFAVGIEFGLSPKEIITSLSKTALIPGRMNIISGLKGSIIIDDSYNASPIAMEEAIKSLSKINSSGRKIAVLGDMLELGRYSTSEHKKLAGFMKDKISKFFYVGIRMQGVEEELLSQGFKEEDILSFDNSIEAGKELQNFLEEGGIVLVKGSQNMRMERVVEEIMRHPEDKEKLLVRQDNEWKGR